MIISDYFIFWKRSGVLNDTNKFFVLNKEVSIIKEYAEFGLVKVKFIDNSISIIDKQLLRKEMEYEISVSLGWFGG